MRNQEGKIELKKKVHRRICVGDVTFLGICPPSSVNFVIFLSLLRFYVEKNFLFQKMGGLWRPCPPSSVYDLAYIVYVSVH